MKKRTLIKLISMVLVVILLGATAGCSSPATPSAPATPATPATPAAPADPAAGYPKKPINIVVGFSAGGDTDLFARAMAEGIGKTLNVSVIVSNMTGAGGSIASTYVKDAAPDGYTAYFCHNPIVGNYITGITDYSNEAFEVANLVAKNDSIYLTLNPNKYKTLDDFIKYCKENPGKATFGAVYGGSFQPMTMGVIKDLGIDVNLIDIGGAANGNIEIAAGRVDAAMTSLAGCKDYFASGKLYPALVASEARKAEYPDVPTLKELGGTSVCEMDYGFYFPKGTDKAIIEAFNKAAEQVVKSEAFAKLTANYGVTPVFTGYGDALKTMDKIQAFYLPYKDIINKK